MSTNQPKGYIPHNIAFYVRVESTVLNGHSGKPAFPVSDEAGGKTVETAKRWAAGRDSTSADITSVENLPRSGYRLVGAEQRDEGGRAWKVITPEGFLVDLREDVFLPMLLRDGLPPGGLIPAEFQWGQMGSQLRLLEVPSDLHGQFETADQRKVRQAQTAQAQAEAAKGKQRKRLKASELELGGVYDYTQYDYTQYGVTMRVVYAGRVLHGGKRKFAWMHIYSPAYHCGRHGLERLPAAPWDDCQANLNRCRQDQRDRTGDQTGDQAGYRLDLSSAPMAEVKVGNVQLPPDYQQVKQWASTGLPVVGGVTWEPVP
ncbi:MAG: hypothetical protein A2Y38_17490 [Spirochaetes bacterium GWB1_59_5]|nr:MAG: hypothetical protein A2Y38_17490 [Spirochaetes bacterium GWB1_59_5]